jgi:hypothetical protein
VRVECCDDSHEHVGHQAVAARPDVLPIGEVEDTRSTWDRGLFGAPLRQSVLDQGVEVESSSVDVQARSLGHVRNGHCLLRTLQAGEHRRSPRAQPRLDQGIGVLG